MLAARARDQLWNDGFRRALNQPRDAAFHDFSSPAPGVEALGQLRSNLGGHPALVHTCHHGPAFVGGAPDLRSLLQPLHERRAAGSQKRGRLVHHKQQPCARSLRGLRSRSVVTRNARLGLLARGGIERHRACTQNEQRHGCEYVAHTAILTGEQVALFPLPMKSGTAMSRPAACHHAYFFLATAFLADFLAGGGSAEA